MVEVNINLTFSKLVAAVILIMAFALDLVGDKSGRVFMFALPFVVALITGKQYFDRGIEKEKLEKTV